MRFFPLRTYENNPIGGGGGVKKIDWVWKIVSSPYTIIEIVIIIKILL